MMERLPQRFCPPSELGNPQRTRVSTFPQRRRLRLSNWTQLLNPRKSNVSTDSRGSVQLNRLLVGRDGLLSLILSVQTESKIVLCLQIFGIPPQDLLKRSDGQIDRKS